MQPFCGMIFIFLLVRIQWNKSNAEGKQINETNKVNTSITDNDQSTVQPIPRRFLLLTTNAINASTISHAAPTTANAKENVTKRKEMNGRPTSTLLMSTDGTTLSSRVTVVSKDGRTNSATSFNNTTSLPIFSTTDDFSGVTKTAASTSTSTVTPSNSTVTYSTPSAAALPSDNSSTNLTTLFPTSITRTSPMVKQDSPSPYFNHNHQTTELNHNFSNPSTASPNAKDANEVKTNKGGVIVGVIVGAILGSILIGLTGYFICVKKRSESFSHRRLYDDTRNDPVLHLDNSLGPYDTSFGCASDDKTSRGNKAEDDNAGCLSNSIPMDDMAQSHPSS